MLDSVRYGIAFLTLATFPFAVTYWYAIHPFVRFWRRRSGVWVVLAAVAALATNFWLVWIWRAQLLATAYPVGPAHWMIAAICYVTAIAIELRCRRFLKFRILIGMPELAADGHSGTLLQEGIYGRIRHPRYVSVTFGVLAAAVFCNYLSIWITAIVLLPALYGIVIVEERELRDRFGEAYVEYSRRVPRFVPRFG
jgi:protein-S-isoprenylcysteine O-methyltransferase Ste14